MSLTVAKEKDLEHMEKYEVTERLYLDAEGAIVPEGDETATELFSTPGKRIPLDLAIEKGLTTAKAAKAAASSEAGPGSELKVPEIKAELKSKGIEFPAKAKKPELLELLVAAENPAADPAGTGNGEPGTEADQGDGTEPDGEKQAEPAKNKQRKAAENK